MASIEEPVKAGPSSDPYEVELTKLTAITEKILIKDDRKDSPKKEFRFFKIAVSGRPGLDFETEIINLRKIVLDSWLNPNDTLDGILSESKGKIAIRYAGDWKKSLLVKEVYQKAKQQALTANPLDADDLTGVYPEIFRLHLARLMNIVQMDQRLVTEITTLETKLRGNDVQANVTPKSGLQGGLASMQGMLGSVPSQYRGLAEKLMQSAPQLLSIGEKITTPEAMASLAKGDLKGMAKRLAKDPEIKKQLSNFAPVLNPAIKSAAEMFKNNATELPKMMPAEPTIESFLDKASEMFDAEDENEASSSTSMQGFNIGEVVDKMTEALGKLGETEEPESLEEA